MITSGSLATTRPCRRLRSSAFGFRTLFSFSDRCPAVWKQTVCLFRSGARQLVNTSPRPRQAMNSRFLAKRLFRTRRVQSTNDNACIHICSSPRLVRFDLRDLCRFVCRIDVRLILFDKVGLIGFNSSPAKSSQVRAGLREMFLGRVARRQQQVSVSNEPWCQTSIGFFLQHNLFFQRCGVELPQVSIPFAGNHICETPRSQHLVDGQCRVACVHLNPNSSARLSSH